MLTEGPSQLGLIKAMPTRRLSRVIAEGSYQRFFPAKTGHWLGLDVQDVGDYRVDGESRLLEPDMVLTGIG